MTSYTIEARSNRPELFADAPANAQFAMVFTSELLKAKRANYIGTVHHFYETEKNARAALNRKARTETVR